MVHEAVLTKAVQGLSDTQPSKSGSSAAAAAAGKEDLQLKRGQFNHHVNSMCIQSSVV